MSYPKSFKDLFAGNRTDKHYMYGNMHVDNGVRTVKIFVNSSNVPARLNDGIDGTGPIVSELSSTLPQNSDGTYENMLLSGGAVVGLGKNWADAELVLLQKDPGAPTDPNRLTMPAGRMDCGLAEHCLTEALQEIVLWGHGDVVYPNVTLLGDSTLDSRDTVRKAAKKGNIPGLSPESSLDKLQYIGVVPESVTVPGGWTIELCVDGELTESVGNMLVVVDEPNNTIEFRQLILLNLPLEKDGISGLEGIADGDGFGRNAVLVSVKNLVSYVDMVQNATEQELRDMILLSQTPALDVTVTSEPANGGRFGKFFWDTKGAVGSLTTTVTSLAEVLK